MRLAAARAAGHLALAELRDSLPEDSALAPLIPVMVALIGTDQSSDVQRQMLLVCAARLCHCLCKFFGSALCRCSCTLLILPISWQVLRKLSSQNGQALVRHYGALIPSLVGLLQQVQGPTKMAGDCTLGKVLQVSMPLRSFKVTRLRGPHLATGGGPC